MGYKYKVPSTAPGGEHLLFPVAWGLCEIGGVEGKRGGRLKTR